MYTVWSFDYDDIEGHRSKGEVQMGFGWSRGAAVLAIAALLVVPAASAATPEQIYRDFAEDNRLDGRYSVSDLQATLQSPIVQGYGDDDVNQGLRPAVQSEIAAQQQPQGQAPQGQAPLGTVRESETLPFTGLDLALLTAGALFLLAFGVSLRRLAKAKR
jgi:hypothetical protein